VGREMKKPHSTSVSPGDDVIGLYHIAVGGDCAVVTSICSENCLSPSL